MRRSFIHLSAPESSIQYLMGAWRFLNLDPPVLHEGADWAKDKQQLFIDSMLCGFDTPKMYFRTVERMMDVDGRRRYINYDVIDGRQRLLAIRGFQDGLYGIPANLRSLKGRHRDDDVHEVTLAELKGSDHDLYVRFESYHLDIVAVDGMGDDACNEFLARLAIPGSFARVRHTELNEHL